MGLGALICRFTGMAFSWFAINIVNLFRRKRYVPFSTLWNGDNSHDYLNNAGYNAFYIVLGIGIFVVVVLLVWNL